MEQMRSEFEKWFRETVVEKPDLIFNDFNEDDDEYSYSDEDWELYVQIQAMYMAWKASRATIEIDAPAEPFYPMPINSSPTDHYHYGRDSIISKVRAAGLRVKEK